MRPWSYLTKPTRIGYLIFVTMECFFNFYSDITPDLGQKRIQILCIASIQGPQTLTFHPIGGFCQNWGPPRSPAGPPGGLARSKAAPDNLTVPALPRLQEARASGPARHAGRTAPTDDVTAAAPLTQTCVRTCARCGETTLPRWPRGASTSGEPRRTRKRQAGRRIPRRQVDGESMPGARRLAAGDALVTRRRRRRAAALV